VTWTITRFAGPTDLDGVLEVDAVCFNRPWSREDYLRELSDPDRSVILVVRAPDGQVAGYCAFWKVVDEIHINNLAIRPEWRRQGLGSALLAAVLAEGRRLGAPRATLEVRRSNEAALRLYERAGFRRSGLRRNYYAHPLEDAWILWFDAEAPAAAS
jgi:ribosomal-protein-alanine N-acetyltransferase